MRLAMAIAPEVRELLHESPQEARALLHEMHDEDRADLILLLEPEERLLLLEQLEVEEAADVFERLDEEEQRDLVERFGTERLGPIVREMAADELTDLVAELPEPIGDRLLETVRPETAAEVEELLGWPEDSAGGLMTTEYLSVAPDMTVNEAIEEVRKQAKKAETVYYAYGLDARGKLLGIASLRDLILADGDARFGEVMNRHAHTVAPETDQEHVARTLRKYDFTALPVVDKKGTMLGVITVDDVMDVMVGEQTEDVHKLGGMEALGAPYLKIAFGRMVRKRGGWLAALFLGEMLTATAMAYFQAEIARAVVLALFVPLIISSGGNSGSQATTLVIRAMALGELKLADWWRVIRRELAAGLALGTLLGAIGFLRIEIWQAVSPLYGEHHILVALTVCASLIGVVTFGTVSGSILPFVLRRLGLDPASASAPFVATLVDVTGLVIYFSVAALILRGTLL